MALDSYRFDIHSLHQLKWSQFSMSLEVLFAGVSVGSPCTSLCLLSYVIAQDIHFLERLME